MESVGGTAIGNTKDDLCNNLDDTDGQRSDDDDDDDNDHHNLGSCGSGDDNHKGRDEDNESLNRSLSSPGALSSLQSPSTSLASPISLLTSPLVPQHGNGLLNAPANDQLQHQQHMQVMQVQQQHLNHQLLQQTKLHHQHQHPQHLPHQQPIGSTTSNSKAPTVLAYDSGTISAATAVVSTLLPTLSTSSSSSSGSMSGYGSATSCSTSTSSTSSPASISDRMVRSLLNGHPAMLLGNRIGHLAMGLTISNNNISNNSNSINNENTYNSLQQTAASPNDACGHLTITSATSWSSTITSLNNLLSENTDKAINQPTIVLSSTLSPSVSSVASSTASSPAATSTVNDSISASNSKSSHISSIPLQRNPIGANPRDVNNPLNINQLTKRSRDESNNINNISGLNSNSNNTSTTAAEIGGSMGHNTSASNVAFNHLQSTHHITQVPLPLPPPHNAMFSNNFSQHFQQKFGHHLATAAITAAAITSTPTTNTQSSRSIVNSSNTGSNVAPNAMPVNRDVGRRSASETSATNESGAISVT